MWFLLTCNSLYFMQIRIVSLILFWQYDLSVGSKDMIDMFNFDERLLNTDAPEEIKKMKLWMFQEQVRIQTRRDELNELSRELQDLKRTLECEKNALNFKEKNMKKRFADNEILIEKKKKIIEDAYQQLTLDRKALECERLNFEYERNRYKKQKATSSRTSYQYDSGNYDNTSFFRGVNSDAELKKRYKELLKIFHPDNQCGDTKTFLRIQTEYEGLRRQYYEA